MSIYDERTEEFLEKITKIITEKDESKKQKTSVVISDDDASTLARLNNKLLEIAGGEINKSWDEDIYTLPTLRFTRISPDKQDNDYEELENKYNDIRNNCKIDVKLIENIDIKNCCEKKFYILIFDENGNFGTIDLLKYQKNIYDYNFDEEEEIKDILMSIKGVYNQDMIETAKKIAEYISRALVLKKAFYLQYNSVGWDNLNGEIIFKYNRIFDLSGQEYKGFCGEDWAQALEMEKCTDEDRFIWTKMAETVLNNSISAATIFAAGVSGVVRQLLTYTKETNINVNILGEKATGKSSFQHFILSFFGDPSELEGSFIDTDSASQRLRSKRNIIPFVLDERMLKVEGDSENKKGIHLLLDIFKEYEGKTREGVNIKEAGQRAYGSVISSSISSVFESIRNSSIGDYDYGQYRRLIEINIRNTPLFGKEDKIEPAEQAKAVEICAYSRYGIGIEMLAEYILNMCKKKELYMYLISLNIEVSLILELMDNYIYGNIDEILKLFDTCNEPDDLEVSIATIDKLKELDKKFNGKKKDISLRSVRELFDSLFSRVVKEIQEEIANNFDEEQMKDFESSVQRFALIVLTGYLLNYSLKFQYTIDDSNCEAKVDMDMNKVREFLIKNLSEKLSVYPVKKIDTFQKGKISQKEADQFLIKFFDWTIEQLDYFQNTEDKKSEKTGKYIGRYTDKNERDFVILLPQLESLGNVFDRILNNMDCTGEEILLYLQNKNGKENGIKYKFTDLVSVATEGVVTKQQNISQWKYGSELCFSHRYSGYIFNKTKIQKLKEKAKNEVEKSEVSNKEENHEAN